MFGGLTIGGITSNLATIRRGTKVIHQLCTSFEQIIHNYMESTTQEVIMKHQPVLLDRVLELLDIQENDVLVDGTLGLGGHARAALLKLGPGGRLIGMDLDNRNMQVARKNLRRFQGKVYYINDSYEKIEHYLKVLKLQGYNKIVLDLGLSSPHLDVAEYGFSYRHKGPLDMRFDKRSKITASVILNKLPEEKLAEIFQNFGELPSSKKLARHIVAERSRGPFVYTTDFVRRIEEVIPNKEMDKRLAMIFQALRIAVNDELNVLYRGVRALFENMDPGGVMTVISYHSLEDRIVKKYFQELLKPPPSFEQSKKRNHGDPLCEVLTKKVVRPLKDEVEDNPRSRSAKLRAVKKL